MQYYLLITSSFNYYDYSILFGVISEHDKTMSQPIQNLWQGWDRRKESPCLNTGSVWTTETEDEKRGARARRIELSIAPHAPGWDDKEENQPMRPEHREGQEVEN